MTDPVEMKECSRPGVLTNGELEFHEEYEDSQAEDTIISATIDNVSPVEIVEDKKIFDIRGQVGYLIQQVDRLQRGHSKSAVDYCRLRRILLSDVTGIQGKVRGLEDDMENVHETMGQIRSDLNDVLIRVEDGQQQANERESRCSDLDNVIEVLVARICRMEARIQAAQSTPLQLQAHGSQRPQQKIRVRCPNCNRDLSKNYLGSHLKKYCKPNTNNNN